MSSIDIKKINWIFFDAGGVLLDDTKHEEQRIDLILKAINNYKPEISKKDVLAARFTASAVSGALTENIIKIFLPDIIQIKEARRFIHDNWDNHQSSFVKAKAKETIEKLAERFSLGLLANQPIKTREKLTEAGVLKYFRFQDVSEDLNLRKPDPKFFTAILKITGAKPIESVMVDDNIERGLIPAKKLGMITIWFKLEDRDIPENVVDYTVETLDDLLKIFFQAK